MIKKPLIQAAIDSIPETGGTLLFAPMISRIDDPAGLKLRSNLTLRMEGATFLVGEQCAADGQAFLGQNFTGVHFQGGKTATISETPTSPSTRPAATSSTLPPPITSSPATSSKRTPTRSPRSASIPVPKRATFSSRAIS